MCCVASTFDITSIYIARGGQQSSHHTQRRDDRRFRFRVYAKHITARPRPDEWNYFPTAGKFIIHSLCGDVVLVGHWRMLTFSPPPKRIDDDDDDHRMKEGGGRANAFDLLNDKLESMGTRTRLGRRWRRHKMWFMEVDVKAASWCAAPPNPMREPRVLTCHSVRLFACNSNHHAATQSCERPN